MTGRVMVMVMVAASLVVGCGRKRSEQDSSPTDDDNPWLTGAGTGVSTATASGTGATASGTGTGTTAALPIDPWDDFTASLEATYSYPPDPPDGLPILDVDEKSGSPQIILDNIETVVAEVDPRVNVALQNIRFRDDQSAFRVADVKTGEWRDTEDRFGPDSENYLSVNSTQHNSVMLVLDVSTSLGADVAAVKEYAKLFVSTVISESVGTAEVGIVGFSSFVSPSEFTQNVSEAHAFIDALPEDGSETKLYQAVSTGASRIAAREDSDGRAIVVFTDGRNNSWDTSQYETIDFVLEQLTALEGTSIYVIGFEGIGDLDRAALRQLAVGGQVEFPEDADALRDVFGSFASQISALYSFTYDVNASRVSQPRRIKFYFWLERLGE